MTTLASSQIRFLRAKAHHLHPVVLLGSKGLTPAVLAEINEALAHHELIKVKVSGDDREARAAVAEEIAQSTESVFVQKLGHIVILFKAKLNDSAYVLPKLAKK